MIWRKVDKQSERDEIAVGRTYTSEILTTFSKRAATMKSFQSNRDNREAESTTHRTIQWTRKARTATFLFSLSVIP